MKKEAIQAPAATGPAGVVRFVNILRRPVATGECIIAGNYSETKLAAQQKGIRLVWEFRKGVSGPVCRFVHSELCKNATIQSRAAVYANGFRIVTIMKSESNASVSDL